MFCKEYTLDTDYFLSYKSESSMMFQLSNNKKIGNVAPALFKNLFKNFLEFFNW